MNIKNIYNKVIEKIKFFLNKDNFTKTKLILCAFLSLALAVVTEYTVMRVYYPQFISKNRMMLLAMIYMFIGIHFVFKLSQMYEFIHKNRYKIACAFLLFVTVLQYSGSSIVNFHSLIQPEIDGSRYHTLLGKARMIRTDEWATSTTYILSQGEGQNKFDYFSNKLRGTKTDMFTVTNSPVRDILMVGRPFQIGFLLLGNDMGLSFYWYARITVMLLGAYELCLILTNKNKRVSLCGALMIGFSAAVQWWYCLDTLIWGQVVLVLVNKFMNTDKKYVKYLCALGIISAMTAYVFYMYPAWQISFGYVFLAVGIWILIKNFKNGYKLTIHDILVIIFTLLCIGLLIGRWYILSQDAINSLGNTAYPGDRVQLGGDVYNLYAYFYNIFFTFEDYPNPCEFSSMLSFYPIPMLLGLIYVIRNKKQLSFWIPTLICGTFLSAWCIVGFPEWLAKITLMSSSAASRASLALGTLNIYMLINLFGNIEKEDKWFDNKKKLYMVLSALVSAILVSFIAYKAYKSCIPDYLGKLKMLVAWIIFFVPTFGILNMNNEKIKKYTMYVIILIALISGLRVNPIIRTTDILYTKPVAIKMQEIRDESPNAIWVVDDNSWHINDYTIANGIRTINSTNVYPNIELYENVLGDKAKENEFTYNRYHHINFNIVDTETEVVLLYDDNVVINLNYNDLDKLDIEYILSKHDINEKGFDREFEKLYDEAGLYIFKVK